MKTLNNVELIGYLGNDPLFRTTSKGKKMAIMRLATDKFRKDDQGNKQKVTTWHDIVAWDNLAANIENQYIKGSHVRVEGEIVYRSYEDKTGHIRYIAEIKAFRLMNLDR